jgi:hypothetical protein
MPSRTLARQCPVQLLSHNISSPLQMNEALDSCETNIFDTPAQIQHNVGAACDSLSTRVDPPTEARIAPLPFLFPQFLLYVDDISSW